jgi:hypothetical protein
MFNVALLVNSAMSVLKFLDDSLGFGLSSLLLARQHTLSGSVHNHISNGGVKVKIEVARILSVYIGA